MDKEPANINWSIPHYVDTSVAVKLVVAEDESECLRDYLLKKWSYDFYITEFAFYETLCVLKRKLEKKCIDEQGYHLAVAKLVAYLDDNSLQIDSDFRLDNFRVLLEVGELAKKHSLDYSDALQIYIVLKGRWSGELAECTAVFVTADRKLAEAARGEGLRVWYPPEEVNPPAWDESK